MTDKELERLVIAFDEDGHLRTADTLLLLAEVRRLRELVDLSVSFEIGNYVVFRDSDGSWALQDTTDLRSRVMRVTRGLTRDEAIAFARERGGR